MGLAKKESTVEKASGVDAAVERLQQQATTTQPAPSYPQTKPVYKQRDFDAEARGKTRCVQFEAAVMSPAIAGMKWNTPEEFITFVTKVADAGVAYTFGERLG